MGVGPAGKQRAVLCVEPRGGRKGDEALRQRVLDHAAAQPAVAMIETVLFHPGFPVDIRHNAKIGREELSQWASGQVR